ncbi:uncharacterized protein SAPINGB_P000034 [Magnusiomyces paraingens]|uniref:Uncharacterized protein n=1 Tax=Magnusiomyces paraingens TaxID=2606893 RepID=A0A5E8B2D7_9ASCO|nr:uncharacterized protein SAPINGB_P000034 [Saprochaete ingens]VVT43545.1 unnamed protein product [Saprochaete ingens]
MNSIPDQLPSLDSVKHIVLVLSGKGGVGKSSVTTQIALTLVAKNYKVGVLDIDLTGPSAPRMFGLEGRQVHQSVAGWVPVYAQPPSSGSGSLAVMSLGFLLQQRGDAVVWRGPKKTAMIRQLLTDMVWGDLDYLLIDTPPGTSDEHISVAEALKNAANPDGAVLVTTPQGIATADVRKELSFCRKVGFNILGVVENMSGYVCPHCSDCSDIFSSGGGLKLAQQFNLPFLGSVPIDPQFVLMIESQKSNKIGNDNESSLDTNEPSLVQKYKDTSALYPIFSKIVDKLVEQIEKDDEADSLNISQVDINKP